MAIQLAFSTAACPQWSLEEAAKQAQTMGYQGLELRTGPAASPLACDPAAMDPARVREILTSAGIAPVCLSPAIVLHQKGDRHAEQTDQQVLAALELAAAIGSPLLRIFAGSIQPGENRDRVTHLLAARLDPLSKRAQDLHVQLLLENTGSFATARPLWTLLDHVSRRHVGAAWNPAAALLAGEASAIGVPLLNTRIRLARLLDLNRDAPFQPVMIGEGGIDAEAFIKRLLGIGFTGFVSVEWDRLANPALTPAEDYLPTAQQKLRGWLDAIAAAKNPPKAKPAHPAAKAAAKPASATVAAPPDQPAKPDAPPQG